MRCLKFSHVRRLLLATVLGVLALTSARAVTLSEGPRVQATETGATIVWSTDVECCTRLSFGTDAKNLTQKAEGPVAATHTITLTNLSPRTTYFFAVGSARKLLGSGSFTTSSAHGGLWKALSAVVIQKPAPAAAAKASPGLSPPPASATWASLNSLPDHFGRHGGDFNATSADDYAAQAWLFLQRAKRDSLPMKLDETDATLRVWDPDNHIFAAYSTAGKTRTFFKPGNPGYWKKQPGRTVKPADLPF